MKVKDSDNSVICVVIFDLIEIEINFIFMML